MIVASLLSNMVLRAGFSSVSLRHGVESSMKLMQQHRRVKAATGAPTRLLQKMCAGERVVSSIDLTGMPLRGFYGENSDISLTEAWELGDFIVIFGEHIKRHGDMKKNT